MPKPTFNEITRLKISDTETLVFGEELKEGKFSGNTLTKYIESDRYTGWAKGGITIPEEMVVDFLKLFKKEDLRLALET